jgi:hypothetical protein
MRSVAEQGPQKGGDRSDIGPAEVARCAAVLERLLSSQDTREAWIIGFLAGSSMASSPA